MITTIAWKEFRSLFATPLAWIILAVMQLILAWVFLYQLSQYIDNLPRIQQFANPPGITEIVVTALFGFAAILLLMAVPLLTMRLFSEEQRNKTLTLLLSAPVSTTEIVLGKFVGLLLFLALVVGLCMLMSAGLAMGGALDWGLIAANSVGLLLLVGAFAALGLFISSLTQHTVIAAFATFGALLLLWILNGLVQDPSQALLYLSLMKHFDSFNRGMVDTTDLAYLFLFAATFLVLTVRQLNAQRLQA